MVYLFLADGFEEIEALTPVDLMRRAKIEVCTVGVGGQYITGAHGICVKADAVDSEVEPENIEMVVLPGGMPGTRNLDASPVVHRFIDAAVESGAHIAAICAAPSVFGKKGLLQGKKAICYPGFEDCLEGAELENCGVVSDGGVTTARAAGSAVDFAAKLIAVLKGDEAAGKILASILA